MTHHPYQQRRAYAVSVRFESDGAPFAQETYLIEASNAPEAERIGRVRAEASVYHNERISGLGTVVMVEDAGPHGPDDDPDPGSPPATPASGARRQADGGDFSSGGCA